MTVEKRLANCSCGAHYTRREWATLRYVGQQDDGEGGWLELRDCSRCGSTISVHSLEPRGWEIDP